MRSKPGPQSAAEQHVREIRRQTRKQYGAEEKIRIVLEGLRGEYSIAELCRREGIAQSLYYKWSKEFLEAGKLVPVVGRTYPLHAVPEALRRFGEGHFIGKIAISISD